MRMNKPLIGLLQKTTFEIKVYLVEGWISHLKSNVSNYLSNRSEENVDVMQDEPFGKDWLVLQKFVRGTAISQKFVQCAIERAHFYIVRWRANLTDEWYKNYVLTGLHYFFCNQPNLFLIVEDLGNYLMGQTKSTCHLKCLILSDSFYRLM